MMKLRKTVADSSGQHVVWDEEITALNFLQACQQAIDLAKEICVSGESAGVNFVVSGVSVQVVESDSAEVQFALWQQRAAEAPQAVIKNVLEQVAAPPYYIWANEDCQNKSADFERAKSIRVDLISSGCESVYIVDADGVEVADEDVLAHEALMSAGFNFGHRSAEVLPERPGAFMVTGPGGAGSFATVGDNMEALISEARDFLRTSPTSVERKVFEVTAAGFDASTDDTDDLVFWVEAPSADIVQKAILDTGATFCGEVQGQALADADFALPAQSMGLATALLEKASDDRSRNRPVG